MSCQRPDCKYRDHPDCSSPILDAVAAEAHRYLIEHGPATVREVSMAIGANYNTTGTVFAVGTAGVGRPFVRLRRLSGPGSPVLWAAKGWTA